jgi:hypothetical protein
VLIPPIPESLKLWNVKKCTYYQFIRVWHWHFLLLLALINIQYTCIHCWKMSNLFVQALETGISSRFRSECKLILYLTTMYIYCVFPAMSKSPKTTDKLLENSWNKRLSNGFQWCHPWCQHLYCYRFFLLLYKNEVPEMLF